MRQKCVVISVLLGIIGSCSKIQVDKSPVKSFYVEYLELGNSSGNVSLIEVVDGLNVTEKEFIHNHLVQFNERQHEASWLARFSIDGKIVTLYQDGAVK